MTGTADTEASEFHSTYKLDVTIIPTNKPIVRVDHEDVVYKTEREKFTAVINELIERHEAGQPVLVGTTSVEKSTAISRILQKKGIKHHVLNAKHHENEAFVVAQAGRKGAITVSTNMAGRGTDILLGGNPEMLAKLKFKEENRVPDAEPEEFEKLVEELTASCKQEGDEIRELGGLYILGTERHESRRIDNQLRGRAGRQGDPGMSRFYLSLEDDLMRIFAGDRVKNLMERMGMPDDEPIEHPWVSKSVENAQKKVEERNFDIRKNLLEYDDVMNSQRKTIYEMRQSLLQGRYEPEILDEEGKPTGERRKIKPIASIDELVRPDVGYLLGMFANDPIIPVDKEGNRRQVTRADFEKVERFVELENMQREVYTRWGVKLDIDDREEDVLGIFDECMERVPLSLTEQRERLLDLMDRILGAMVEESCPAQKPPEDWDWGGIFQGFREHFGVDLPDEISDVGDPETLARELYDRAEALYEKREKEIGVELSLRIFRHLYLEELDKSWVDHLTDMDHLRDGIGLRGYGQKDPKREYKKEGYNLFVNMVARVSSNVITKLFAVSVRRAEEEERRIEADEAAWHEEEMRNAVPRHEEQLPLGANPQPALPEPEPPAVTGEMECPCGSGKPFSKCHGAEGRRYEDLHRFGGHRRDQGSAVDGRHRRRDDQPLAAGKGRQAHAPGDRGDLRGGGRPDLGRGGRCGRAGDPPRGAGAREDPLERGREGAAHRGGPQGGAHLHGGGDQDQRHPLLLGVAGAARGQGRGNLHLAVRRPHRRHRRRRHGAHRPDRADLPELQLPHRGAHGERAAPGPLRPGGHDRRARGDAAAQGDQAAHQAPADGSGAHAVPGGREEDPGGGCGAGQGRWLARRGRGELRAGGCRPWSR
jgi:preprotein translocase subunit SecA